MTETKTTQPIQSVSKNLPQWKNDIAVVMRVAVGGRKYIILPPRSNHDDRFTEKMQRQFSRVATSVGLVLVVGTTVASLRDKNTPRNSSPLIYTSDVSALAVTLLEEYQRRGGRVE